jgi:hypothetical protein
MSSQYKICIKKNSICASSARSRTAGTYYDVIFVYIFYTVTVLAYIYGMILLYSDLSPTILTEVAQQGIIVAP